jgi:diguanylate cyclase (GGDEF)-like protein/PAS domain S-box-containing protein
MLLKHLHAQYDEDVTQFMPTDRHSIIRQLFGEYIEMYAARDDRLTEHFSENFSGYAGSGDLLVKDRETWIKITRQDFSQVKDRIRIEMLDLCLQDLSDDVVVATAFFHIHLPTGDELFSREVARLVLIFRLEGDAWKIVHSGISIPYRKALDGEVYPLASLKERNEALEALVQERTRQLTESQTLYKLLTDDTLDVLWKADRNLVITYVSPADERLRGFKAEEVIGHHVFEMFTEEGVALVKKLMAERPDAPQGGARGGFVRFEVQHRSKDGRLLWAEVLSKPERDVDGKITGFHGISRETTQRREMQEQVRQLAFYDALTQLPNRRLLGDRLNQAMASSERSGHYGAVMFLDLDNFKSLNDSHGHKAGDLLLIEAGKRLTSGVRSMDTVARFGGDEFVVMCPEFDDDEASSHLRASAVAEKIRASLAEPYLLEIQSAAGTATTVDHRCTASIGVTIFYKHAATQDEIFKRADTAMYQAKDAGRNRVKFTTAV